MTKVKTKSMEDKTPVFAQKGRVPAWIKEAQAMRRSNLSAVVIVETQDEGRIRELQDWALNRCQVCNRATSPMMEEKDGGSLALRAKCVEATCGNVQAGHLMVIDRMHKVVDDKGKTRRFWQVFEEKLLVMTPFQNLREYRVGPDGYYFEKRVLPEGIDEVPMGEPIVIGDMDLRLMFEQMAGKQGTTPEDLREHNRRVIIMRWPYTTEDERQGYGHLSDAIMDLATHEKVLNTTQSTIFLFVTDRNKLRPEAVNAASVIVPETSSKDERARIVWQAIDAYNKAAAASGWETIDQGEEQCYAVADTLGGLDLDRTNMAIAECLNRHGAVNLEFLAKAKAEIISKAGHIRFEQVPEVTFDHVGGYTEQKDEIYQNVVLPVKHPEVVRFFNKQYKPSKLIVLAGPPGTGKSLLARAIINAVQLPFASIHADSMRHSLVGESEKRTRAIFRTLYDAQPCGAFMDEAEGPFGKRGGQNLDSGVSRNVLGIALGELDDPAKQREYILILATNRPQDLDPAIISRADLILYVGYADEAGLSQVFAAQLRAHKKGVPITDDLDFAELGRRALGMSNREIRTIVELAIKRAGKEMIDTGQPTPLAMRHLVASIPTGLDLQKRLDDELKSLDVLEEIIRNKEHLEQERRKLAAMRQRLKDGPGRSPSQSAAPMPAPAAAPAPSYLKRMSKKVEEEEGA